MKGHRGHPADQISRSKMTALGVIAVKHRLDAVRPIQHGDRLWKCNRIRSQGDGGARHQVTDSNGIHWLRTVKEGSIERLFTRLQR